MKFHADASVKRQLVDALRDRGLDVSSQLEIDPTASDDAVLAAARSRDAILLTEDKDFGELVFKRRLLSVGVILVRVAVAGPGVIERVAHAICDRGPKLREAFTTINSRGARTRPLP